MVRVIMNGCNGKMGGVITGLASDMDDLSIVAGVDVCDAHIRDYPVFTSLDECDVPADVVIDFSSPSATDDLLDACVRKDLPLILCTTGLSDDQLKKVEEDSEKVAILRSANMSLGINLLLKILKEAAPVLADAGFDMEVIEMHHNQKVDAPSGTAIALADAMNEAAGGDYHIRTERASSREKRDKHEIGISSVRGGTIVGEHDVIFAGPDEVIRFDHTAYSKAVFGKGALEAARFMAGKGPGLYDMADVISAASD